LTLQRYGKYIYISKFSRKKNTFYALFLHFYHVYTAFWPYFLAKKGPLMSTQNAARDIHHGRHLSGFLPDSNLTRYVQARNFIV